MIRILFVEDDPVVMSNLRRVLSTMRRVWDMRFVPSGEDALATLAESRFDVIVTDLSMPGLTGGELLALAQYRYPHMVRVLLSEAHRVDAVVRSAGVAHRILPKPFDPSELSFAIQRAFELEQRLNDPDLQAMVGEIGLLPSPSSAVLELNDLLAQSDSSVEDIARVVESDAAMTAKLLQVVNSAYFSLSAKVTDVTAAVTYLGLDTVRNLIVAMELLRSFEEGPTLVQSAIDEIHERSQAVACVARELVTDRTKASEAYVAALLHDVGLLVVATQMPDRFLSLRVQAMRSNLPLTELELQVVGARHADLGAHLLDLWGLPFEIVEAVARHHEAPDVPTTGMEPVHAVFIADAIVSGELDSAIASGAGLDAGYLEHLGVAERVYRLAGDQ